MAWWPSLPPLNGLVTVCLGSMTAIRWSPRVAGFTLGFCWCCLAAHGAINTRWDGSDPTQVNRIEGHVVSMPVRVGESLRFELATHASASPRQVRVYWYRPSVFIEPGQVWRLPVRLESPSGQLNFSGFDYERYLLVEGIDAVGRVVSSFGAEEPVLLGTTHSPIIWANQARHWLFDRIQATTPRIEVAGLKQALLIGERSGIDDDIQGSLLRTGTAHLLAISGLHIGLVFAFAMGVVRWLYPLIGWLIRQPPRQTIGLVVASFVSVAYAGLAGFSTSAVRAMLMVLVFSMLWLLRRRARPFDALLYAAVAILVVNPLSVLGVGFWLSFGAVAFLIWRYGSRSVGESRWQSAFQLLDAQWMLGLALLPLSLGVFGQTTPIALLANLIAIPWVSVVVLPSALIDGLMITMLDGPSPVSWLCDGSIELLIRWLDWLSGFDWGHQWVPYATPWSVLVGLVGAVWFLAHSGWPSRGLGLLLMAPLVFPRISPKDPTELRLYLADVGSGLAALVEVDGYRLLYGLGPGDGKSADRISTWLRHWPRSSSDGSRLGINDVVLPRPHSDFQGGLGELAKLASVQRLYVAPSPTATLDWMGWAPMLPCQRGVVLYNGPWTIDFIHPGPHLPDLGASSSCVVRIQQADITLLLAGALDGAGEKHLISVYPELQGQIVILGQSGHKNSGTLEWLEHLDPELVLVSVSDNDRFGRPHPELLSRLSSQQAAVLATASCGGVSLRVDASNGSWHAQAVVRQHPRFWRNTSDCLQTRS